MRSIIKDICRNSHRAFGGFGRHCANDVLYRLAIHPGTPCHIICNSISAYQKFKKGIYEFIAEFSSPKFLRRVATRTNTENPFTFNERSNREYLSAHIDVFRRVKVCIFVYFITRLISDIYLGAGEKRSL